jgi:hypothetical protein
VIDGPADEGRSTPDVGAKPEAGGVFGNLPRSRPGTRSPRRDEQRRDSTAQRAPRKAQATGRPDEARSARQEPRGPAASEPPEPERVHGGGLEDLAWAGVAAAAEAATIGVRLASRAMEAVKDAGKRS